MTIPSSNTYKSILEKANDSYLIHNIENDIKISTRKFPIEYKKLQLNEDFDEQGILDYIRMKKIERGNKNLFEKENKEKVESLIGRVENELKNEGAKRLRIDNIEKEQNNNSNIESEFLQKSSSKNNESQEEKTSSQDEIQNINENVKDTENKNVKDITENITKNINSTENHKPTSLGPKDQMAEKEFQLSHDGKGSKIGFEISPNTKSFECTVNDEIARSWLNLTYKKEYSIEEFCQFKLNNEIEDLEKYLRNRAPEAEEKIISVDYQKIDSLIIEHSWPKEEHEKFLEYFNLFNKKFHVIAKLLKKPTKEVILHYYHTKKKERYNKKKNGRISDTNLKTIVDFEWNESERNKFLRLFDFYGKNWQNYIESFSGKSAGDFKNYYRYLTKNLSSVEGEELAPKNNETEIVQKKEEDVPPLVKVRKKRGPGRKKKTNVQPKTAEKGKKGRKKKIKIPPLPTNEDKENITNHKHKINVVQDWTIDERQLFAIFYPYIGKNWVDLAQYITTKKPNDCRTYFKFYFKNLSIYEQKLEAAMRNVERVTLSVPSSPKRLKEDDFIEEVGIVFKK